MQLVVYALVLFLLYLLVRGWVGRSYARYASHLQNSVPWFFLLLVVLLLITRFHVVTALAGVLAVFLLRALPLLLQFGPLLHRWWRQRAQQTSSGGPYEVRTEWVHVWLDEVTGQPSGEILRGVHAGKPLSALGLAELRALWRQLYLSEPQSAALLAAYLDRRFRDGWREGAERADTMATGNMSREQAYAVLGLSTGAGRDEIVVAHRRLMARMHPDRGGSDLLAAMINRAKDVLLEGL